MVWFLRNFPYSTEHCLSMSVVSRLLDTPLALLPLSSRARCRISGAFAFLLISFFPIAGRAQYFLQPDFQWVWAGAGDHQEGHHCYRPRSVLRQPQATGWTAGHRGAGPEQPCSQVRGHILAPLSQNSHKSYLKNRDIFRETPKQCAWIGMLTYCLSESHEDGCTLF